MAIARIPWARHFGNPGYSAGPPLHPRSYSGGHGSFSERGRSRPCRHANGRTTALACGVRAAPIAAAYGPSTAGHYFAASDWWFAPGASKPHRAGDHLEIGWHCVRHARGRFREYLGRRSHRACGLGH